MTQAASRKGRALNSVLTNSSVCFHFAQFLMDKHFWYRVQFEVVSTANIFRKHKRRLGKISSNVREILIKLLGNIKKASVEFQLEKMALVSIWFDGKVCLIAFHIEELSSLHLQLAYNNTVIWEISLPRLAKFLNLRYIPRWYWEFKDNAFLRWKSRSRLD